jgi:phosphoglycolate phosphatase-like HAD superfamily hydrolase
MINIFDCDGVILDSKEAHWKFYEAFSRIKGFELKREDFERAIVDVPSNFWKTLGVPQEFVKEANQTYVDTFRDYEVDIFPGVVDMLYDLRKQGRQLSMATFNRRPTLEKHLGNALGFFDKVLTYEDGFKNGVLNKAHQIEKLVNIYRRPKSDFRLIGDTRWDLDAAQQAGIEFVGVNYGWTDFSKTFGFPVVDSVVELWEHLEKSV